MMTLYQETWVKGRSTGERYQRECASRYAAIKAFLEQYERPFSVFDLGANAGYFAFRIAEDFPQSTVIAADNKSALRTLAVTNGLPNVLVLNRRLQSDDLDALAQCEAFDVVMCLNVLHHMEAWRSVLPRLRYLGAHLIVETPGRGDTGAAGKERHDEILAWAEGSATSEMLRSNSHVTAGADRIMFHLRGWRSKQLTRQTLDAKARGAPTMGAVTVTADFETCRVTFDRGEDREFVPGMNLWNFLQLSGVWPENVKQRVVDEVERIKPAWMDDLRPWNFVLTGDRAHAIDIGNKEWRTAPEPGGLDVCMRMIRV